MKWMNSIIFRFVRFMTRNYTIKQKEGFLAGMMHFIAANETAENKNKLRLIFYDQRLRAFPVISISERIRLYGWFDLIAKLQNVEGDIVEAGTGYGPPPLPP